MANNALVQWFDALESALEADSKLCGLLSHRPTVGQAREFVVARMLRTILPASVHIGSGIVVASDGKTSKQIDIVVYDPRFPFLKVDGGGLYFVEGVLATVEVKSTIDSTQLIDCLENSRSVLELIVNGEHPKEAEDRIQFYMAAHGLPHDMAKDRFNYMLGPATYVFAFTSKLSFETTGECITSWWNGTQCRVSQYWPLLPRVINIGTTVGLVNDGRIGLQYQDDVKPAMGLFKTQVRFRWLAMHIMDAVSFRLGLRNFGLQFDYRISDYYPFDAYIATLRNAQVKYIRFNPPSAPSEG